MPLSAIVVWIILLIAAWAVLASFARGGGKEKGWIWLNRILLVLFIFVIFISTLINRHPRDYTDGWQLFGKIKLVSEQPEYYREMLMNIFLFVPFGLMAPFTFIRSYSKDGPRKTKRTVLNVILLAFFLSLVIELLQMAFSIGRPEAEDIICNTLGAAIGTTPFVLWRSDIMKA